MLKRKNILDSQDLSIEEIEEIISLAQDIIKQPQEYADLCKGKLLATLFYEPSTRTRLSFEAAMLRLGGQVIGFSDSSSSSVKKGESLADTIQTVSCYADIIAMRHPNEGAPKYVANISKIPIINAGDGGHQHPTQTLADLLTIREARGSFEKLKIGVCGDLKFGRTVHSLIKTMSRYEGVEFVLISPKELKIPSYIKEQVLDKNEIKYMEVEKLEDVMEELDILYMTRVQKERFFNEADYVRLKDSYILDRNKLEKSKSNLAILHPLPRVNEISEDIDNDSRAWYFKQAKFGMYMRMALILKVLGVK